MGGPPEGSDQRLLYAQDLGALRRVGRSLRRRIEEEAKRSLRKVLVVQEDPMMRALLVATLSPESYDIIEAGSVRDALMLLTRERPSLMLLDAVLPDGSGHELCRQVKARPELSETFVILLSPVAEGADREAALAAGADAHMPKPYSPLLLLKTIEELLC
jgi:two-component system, OmpR family, phosphate regulon response regulator PhoB